MRIIKNERRNTVNIDTILAGISTAQKVLPIIEQVGKEIGPLVQEEVVDGKAVWEATDKALKDLQAAFVSLKAATQATPRS